MTSKRQFRHCHICADSGLGQSEARVVSCIYLLSVSSFTDLATFQTLLYVSFVTGFSFVQ